MLFILSPTILLTIEFLRPDRFLKPVRSVASETSENQEIAKKVVQILRNVAKTIEENPQILTDTELSLLNVPVIKRKTNIPLIDFSVFEVFAKGGEPALRKRLEPFEIKILKGIIAKNSFDPSKLTQKWRKNDRLIDFIVERVTARSNKGQAFREYS